VIEGAGCAADKRWGYREGKQKLKKKSQPTVTVVATYPAQRKKEPRTEQIGSHAIRPVRKKQKK